MQNCTIDFDNKSLLVTYNKKSKSEIIKKIIQLFEFIIPHQYNLTFGHTTTKNNNIKFYIKYLYGISEKENCILELSLDTIESFTFELIETNIFNILKLNESINSEKRRKEVEYNSKIKTLEMVLKSKLNTNDNVVCRLFSKTIEIYFGGNLRFKKHLNGKLDSQIKILKVQTLEEAQQIINDANIIYDKLLNIDLSEYYHK